MCRYGQVRESRGRRAGRRAYASSGHPGEGGSRYAFTRVAWAPVARRGGGRARCGGGRRADRRRDGTSQHQRGASARRAAVAVPERSATGQPAGPGSAVADDAGREDRSDDPGRARQRGHRHVEDHDGQSRKRAVGWGLGADAQHADGVGGHGRPLSEGGACHAPTHSDPVRHRHRARRREHVRRDGVPA